jgi:hypothetical protein
MTRPTPAARFIARLIADLSARADVESDPVQKARLLKAVPGATVSRRKTPAARALVGAIALRDGATINAAFKLAGYELRRGANVNGNARGVFRGDRLITTTRHAGIAAEWLTRVGRKLEALGVGKAAA